MKPSEHEYVLGTDRAELERLGLQHQLWSEHAPRAWERAGFQRGMKLLDVGCGPGFATFDPLREYHGRRRTRLPPQMGKALARSVRVLHQPADGRDSRGETVRDSEVSSNSRSVNSVEVASL